MERKGFTLVEILIVVIILGILAAIVVPQFTEAGSDAKVSALSSDLVTQLTTQTDASGAAGTDFGPYLTKFPSNPFTSSSDVDLDGTKGDDSHAWYFNTTTGEFAPDDAAHSSM
jgi:prepilin-type N-terminal cleavage/methylation domain-containing protein